MKLFRKMKEAGFSLVELLVVVAIIAMLAAVGLPMYNRYKAKSAQNAATSSARQYVNAFKSAYGNGNDTFKISGITDTFQVDTVAAQTNCLFPNYTATGDTTPNCFVSRMYRDSLFQNDCVVYVRQTIALGETTFNVSVIGIAQATTNTEATVLATGADMATCYDFVGDGTQGNVLSATVGDAYSL